MTFMAIVLWAAAGVLFLISLSLLWWYGWEIRSLLSGGGPYVPTAWSRVESMIRLAEITPRDRVIDLGSGDGRLVIAAAQSGAAHALGYEIHPSLVRRSRKTVARKGLSDRAFFERKSLWQANLGNASVIFVYQIPYAMQRISDKLEKEVAAGTRIVSNGFLLPGWRIMKEENGVRLYTKS